MRLCRSHVIYTHMQAHTHPHMHAGMHSHTSGSLKDQKTKNQTYTKLLKQTQIPHYRFGFGTWYSNFLKNLKWFVDIAADRQRRYRGKLVLAYNIFSLIP